MIRKTNDLVDKIYVKLFPSRILPEKVEDGPLVFHKNGNVSLIMIMNWLELILIII